MAVGALWNFGQDSGYLLGESLVGFTVGAADGTIGRVERQEDRINMQHLVVDTGVWKFGGSVLIPAGIVTVIDSQEQTVSVSPSRDDIKTAPRFATDSETTDQEYLTEVGDYYHALGF
ncbi:PRC-barrel domain containing protein [Streptomyces cyaneofuscatus]|uniref:PRC-barrel domain containing protein n=1 Tax=Streptomyces cyaneofuscatus TaxID=66883 RepID=UPI00380FE3A1